MYFLTQIYNGMSVGAIYALIAIGFSMVYGVLRLLNFAHSELITIGAYAPYLLSAYFLEGAEAPFLYALVLFLLSGIVGGLSAVVFFYVGYKSVYRKSRIAVLISAIGISVLIQSLIIFFFSAKSHATVSSFLGHSYTGIILLALVLLFITWGLKRTQLGIWMRAVSDDYDIAQLMGINPGKVIVAVFFIGGALAGFAGCIISMQSGSINPRMGYIYGLKAFAISVAGGIGNLWGAAIVGVLLGISEVLFQAFLPDGINHLNEAFAFILLLVILFYKPKGLLTRYLS